MSCEVASGRTRTDSRDMSVVRAVIGPAIIDRVRWQGQPIHTRRDREAGASADRAFCVLIEPIGLLSSRGGVRIMETKAKCVMRKRLIAVAALLIVVGGCGLRRRSWNQPSSSRSSREVRSSTA